MANDNSPVSIVTGAARGIGAATAERLANDGLRVAITNIDESGAAATALHIDVHPEKWLSGTLGAIGLVT